MSGGVMKGRASLDTERVETVVGQGQGVQSPLLNTSTLIPLFHPLPSLLLHSLLLPHCLFSTALACTLDFYILPTISTACHVTSPYSNF